MHGLRVLVFVLLLSSLVFSQELTRDQKMQKINDLRSQIGTLEKDILQPAAADIALASKQGLEAVRLMPREKYDRILAIRGGGAYYSFAFKRQEYGRGSDIGFEQGYLSVGFAGADYGFIFDMGESPLSGITKDSGEAIFLMNYKPPGRETEVRSEARKAAYDYDVNGLKYTSRRLATVGHSYLLRSISFDDSDTLVAFKVIRKDTDGSLILFWKTIESFEKPTFVREQVAEK